VLDELPLTRNGKVDRQKLPDPEGRPEEAGQYVAPRTPVEEALAGIWANVLRLDRVGVHDDFFQLGGHSLLATRIIVQARDALGVRLPLRALFEHPTVARLAESIFRDIMAREPSESLEGALADVRSIKARRAGSDLAVQ
jgi:acyl carrier protein